ncbi:MAG: hypothetical protein IKK38_11305 [Spirochaetaceae bacterium]|nr:hypothetical protein [Spirochaetaceae bacterium]
MIDELNFPKAKYQCICSDCKHIFVSDKSPLPRKSAFSRKGAQADASASTENRAPAFSAEQLKAEKSPIRCPKCGGQHILLGAISD